MRKSGANPIRFGFDKGDCSRFGSVPRIAHVNATFSTNTQIDVLDGLACELYGNACYLYGFCGHMSPYRDLIDGA